MAQRLSYDSAANAARQQSHPSYTNNGAVIDILVIAADGMAFDRGLPWFSQDSKAGDSGFTYRMTAYGVLVHGYGVYIFTLGNDWVKGECIEVYMYRTR
jgi:hypothetical protein